MRRLERILEKVVPHTVLVGFSLAILLPLVWIVRVSLTDKLTAYKIPPEIGTFGFFNYVEVLTEYPFISWFVNSLIVALAATAISLPLATAMAYAFARFNTGGPGLRLGLLASQMLPPIILLLPLFAVFLSAGLMQSRIGLIIAHMTISLPFLAWMLVSFFQGDIAALEEAARVDGATRWQAFTKIAVPVAAPGILAAGLLGFILSWNELFFSLTLTGTNVRTLPTYMATEYVGFLAVDWGKLSAAGLLATVPVVVIVLVLQKYLVRGLSLGAVK